jgi:hypothetical protein
MSGNQLPANAMFMTASQKVKPFLSEVQRKLRVTNFSSINIGFYNGNTFLRNDYPLLKNSWLRHCSYRQQGRIQGECGHTLFKKNIRFFLLQTNVFAFRAPSENFLDPPLVDEVYTQVLNEERLVT